MTLNDLIRAAASGYPDTMVLEYWDFDGAKPRNNPDGGDTLARFVALELAETFDGDANHGEQVSEAVRVLTRAVDDLQAVIRAIERLGSEGGGR